MTTQLPLLRENMRIFFIIILLKFHCSHLIAQSDSCELMLKMAKEVYEENDYEKALNIYDNLLKDSCTIGDFEGLYQASILSLYKNRLDDAKRYIEKSISIATFDEIETIKSSNQYSSLLELTNLDLEAQKRIRKLISHHQELSIFNQSKEYTYSAVRIAANNDTIANTVVKMIPQGTGWGHPAASLQSEVIYSYTYTSKDSINNIAELDSVVTKEFWIKNDTTGIIENKEQVWIHPIRNNQFYKTEIAPFPTVNFPISQTTTRKANNKIVIFKNWGTYSPTITESKYYYEGEQQKEYPWCGQINCHRYSAYAHNSKFGISFVEYFFNEEYGFVEMNYQTYDNEKIEFKLIHVN